MTEEQLQKEIRNLWKIVSRLEATYQNDKKKFTIDGHLLGSIGEVYAKEKFKLKLLPNSEKVHDAIDEKTRKLYQIKITQRNKVGLRNNPDNLIVIKIDKDGKPHIVYNGLGNPVWNEVKHKNSEQKFISLNQLDRIKKT
ncbi:MAG: hypothetical protein WCL06_00405 [Bacteroidota bacterium]